MKQNVQLENKTILITGAAGFIGANLVMKLMRQFKSLRIIGVDNMNDYYGVSLKEYCLGEIENTADGTAHRFDFINGDISDKKLIDELFEKNRPEVVVNLAALSQPHYSHSKFLKIGGKI